MTLKEHIDDIRNKLEEGLFINEAAVSNGIVRRLLDALDWSIYNPQVIIPEYSVEGRKVDFDLSGLRHKADVGDERRKWRVGWKFPSTLPISRSCK